MVLKLQNINSSIGQSINQNINIIWFENNLRTTDNQALFEASKDDQLCIPVYIFDPYFYQENSNYNYASPVRTRFLLQCLQWLDLDIKLNYFKGGYAEVIQKLVIELLAQNLNPTLYYTPKNLGKYEIDQQKLILDFFESMGLKVVVCNGDFVEQSPTTGDWRAKYYEYNKQPLHLKPDKINLYPYPKQNGFCYSLLEFATDYPSYCRTKSSLFEGGEINGKKALDKFLTGNFEGYHWKLSVPHLALNGSTSLISPHLVFGTLSNREISQQVKQKISSSQNAKHKFSLQAYLDRLRWQASFHQRYVLHPEIEWQNRFAEFDQIYNTNALTGQKLECFEAWKAGKTGFPLVDASMWCLNQTGWINFRMRAMCATFLTINCGVSWHFGAQYFMQKLVDGDIAINHWQWQMQAGITNPLSPIFRIYNPTKNMIEKDPNLEFVQTFVPELGGYNLNQILLGTHYEDGAKYPKPMLDFLLTKRINGKVVADLRQKVRERILKQKGQDYENGLITKQVVEKYYQIKDKHYKDMQEGEKTNVRKNVTKNNRKNRNKVNSKQENLF